MLKKILVPVAPLLLLVACAGLPPANKPPVLNAEVPLAGTNLGIAGNWPDAQWWKRYDDPQLNALMQLALHGSPTLAAAQSRFDNAVQAVHAAAAAAGVRVGANADWDRQRLSNSGLIPPAFLGFHWYSQADLGLQFSYDFDFWGKQRATIESVVDQVHAAEAESASAELTLTSAVADTYFGWQGDRARLELAQTSVNEQAQMRQLNELRVNAGIDSPDVLREADANLAAAREQVLLLDGSAQLRIVALAALTGVAPAKLPKLQPRPLPQVDSRLPANASIDLIARRPDIVANRWRVESAARNVDEARGEFFPDISINALAGLSAIDMSQLLKGSSRVFNFDPALHLPIFDGGLIKARYGVSKAELDAAVSAYNNTLLDAARDLASQALTAQQVDARRKERSAQLDAVQALRDSADARARQGLTDARSTLSAEVQLLQQRDALASLDAQALSANIALIKALGGGYTAPAKTKKKS